MTFCKIYNKSHFFNVLDIADIDRKVEYLMKCVFAVIDFHIPVKKIKITRPPAPWLTHTIREMQKLRDSAHKKYINSRSEHSWIYYKEIRNYVGEAIDRERKAY